MNAPVRFASGYPSRLIVTALSLVFFLCCFTSLPAQTATTGSIEGRVFNATNGNALRNVRVTAAAGKMETTTNDDGSYYFSKVPAGAIDLTVHYVGFATQTAAVTVTADGTVQRDFDLSLAASTEETIQLDKFTVVADKEMSAQAVALNERLNAPNIKNVVAYDEYGDRSAENIGDFLRFLPGVGIDEPAQLASSVTLRGFPANNSGIQIDGADVASARGNSREQSLLDIPVGNVSRVEVTKVPTPDMPASGLGGSLNIIRKSGLEAKKPIFTYQTYFILDERQLTLDGGPRGPSNDLSPKYQQPSLEFSYLHPVNKNFALSFSGSRTWRLKPMERDDYTDTQGDWNFTNGYQRLSTWQSLSQVFRTWSGQVGADWKISDKDTLGVNVQYRSSSSNIMRVNFVANYGAGATGDRSFTQGSTASNGIVQQASGDNQETGADTIHSTLKYLHRENDWKLEGFAAFSSSASFLDDIDNNHFNTVDSNLSGVILRGEGIGETNDTIPIRYTATRAGAPVDVYDGNNYTLGNPTSAQNEAQTNKFTGRLDFTREFSGSVPFTLKSGVYIERMERDRRVFNKTWTFRPNGLTTAAARSAALFDVFDSDFNADAPTVYGNQMDWISVSKVYALYKQNPDWFALNEPLAHQNQAVNSSYLVETVSAAYLRGDVRLMNRRLWLSGGVRFEKTKDDGLGVLNDPSAQYQKDANGDVVDGNPTQAGLQPIFLTSDLLARAKQRYVERGTHVVRSYSDYYPSLNTSYKITDKLVLRAAYARTLGRPNINFVIPGITASEPTAAQPTITVANTALKPWTADNYDLSLESYQIKGGFGSVGVFRKDVQDFFGTITYPASSVTPELLESLGIPNDPLYLGNYDIATQINTGDAKITGVEFAYNQSLLFLPNWARGFQVFASATKLKLEGGTLADFTGYSPQNLAGGINFVRPRFYIKFTVTYQGVTRGPFITPNVANGIPDETYTYQGERLRFGLNTQYSFSKKFSVYASIANIGGFIGGNLRYSPTTPEYMKERRRQEFPATVQIGVKGQF